MIKEEAVKLKAKLGSGEKRQTKKEALVGVSYTVDPKPRSPKRWPNSWLIQKRHARAGSGKTRETMRPELNRSGVWPAWCGRSRR